MPWGLSSSPARGVWVCPRGFKRALCSAAQRVIMNHVGDLIVRPFPLEIRTHANLFSSSVAEHLLKSYQESFVAVATGQFTTKRVPGGLKASGGSVCPSVRLSVYLCVCVCCGREAGSLRVGEGGSGLVRLDGVTSPAAFLCRAWWSCARGTRRC
jgi:hypothetical protein